MVIDLYNGEALEIMDKLIEQGVVIDAIITDPPYGTTACSWDSVIPFDAMWSRLNKLIKPNGAIVLFGSEPFSSALRMSNIKMYKYDWKWVKDKGSNYVHANYQPLKNYEDVIIFSKGGSAQGSKSPMVYNRQFTLGEPYDKGDGIKTSIPLLSGGNKDYDMTNISGKRNPLAVQKIKSSFKKGEKVHPTQKPVELMEYLIKTYTNEDDVVLDFTMGSGTTGVACMNLNRKFIGIELDKDYFKIAEDRIKKSEIQKPHKNKMDDIDEWIKF